MNAFIKSENKPEWMILEAIPVIPPELRPMVQLDGGRFATSDLNDLYRRVINRNNRLKRLLDLGAPEIIVNNEKRMLQEAVDALFDNGRRGRAVTGPGNRPLKSLSDMLKGKQGRFRQNLLGKRVDYSGRSVIVAGPNLRLHQCGLPKLMALELFKPFIMSRLVERKSVQNIKAAKKYVDSMIPEVWDVLEEVIAEHPVLLNRAPTLHRLGIQAFEPVLVEGKAIQVHPLVCHAFNADFDGDQMAVHLPLSAEAQAEARILMLSSNNILSPANGRPLATPTQDMVLGDLLPHLRADRPRGDDRGGGWRRASTRRGCRASGRRRRSSSRSRRSRSALQDADRVPLERRAAPHDAGPRHLQRRGRPCARRRDGRGRRRRRARLHQPARSRSARWTSSSRDLVDRYGAHDGRARARHVKTLGFHYATQAGVTISKNDIVIPPEKEEILAGYEERVAQVEQQYERGLITEDERHESIVEHLDRGDRRGRRGDGANLYELNPIFMMANSGARGSFKQIRQLAGMRGLMANPKGEIIERPIKANFMEGLSVLEYFISTHGARKGLADTALRTADSGYLTRRLVDVSQDVIIREEDCGTSDSIELPLHVPEGVNKTVARPRASPPTSSRAARSSPTKGEEITPRRLRELVEGSARTRATVRVPVRSVLKCRAETGVCQACYGTFLATGDLSEIGDAVGIIAAQSIGEPGTQLTMRTFHTGGVAGADITHGLPRVVEIFEARNPKGAATLADGRRAASTSRRPSAGRRSRSSPRASTRTASRWPRSSTSCRGARACSSRRARSSRPGDPLHEGSLAPAELLELKGSTAIELYLVGEVQKVYKSQGVDIHDKHIELIVRQMLKKVRVREAGETELLPGQLVDKLVLERENARVAAAEGRAGDVRAAHPRDHEGVARDRVVPLGRLLPGDDEGAHRRRDRGQGRPPARAQGERDHRQADPGRDRAEALPDDRDQPVREGAGGDVHAAADARRSCWRR